MTFRVACVGGGPGGLFFSTLLKRRMPEADVVLFERNQAADAFGFGVVFSDATLNAINEADPVLRDGLRDHGKHWDSIEVWLKGQKRSFAGNGMAAIHRRTLLPLLQDRAAAAGVEMRFGHNVPSPLQLRDDFDVVVGADGANSRTREDLAGHVGHTSESATAKFIWFGTTHRFNGLTFIHRKSEFGNFAAHAYPISDDVSTFIVETDDETWRRAGLDAFDVTQPPGPSDEKTRRFLEELFAEDIDGGEVIANNSRWGTFQTRRTASWHHENTVLLGDAVHTAHFSVGSGTKMAMEDAIVLAEEIAADTHNLSRAFAAYQAKRSPQVAKIQNAARGGLSWWEHFGRYYDAFEPTQFAFHFFSRSIGIDKVAQRDPGLVDAARSAWEEQHGFDALGTPLELGPARFSSREMVLEVQDGTPLRLTDATGTVVLSVTADPAAGDAGMAVVLQAPDKDSDVAAAAAALTSDPAAVVIPGGTSLTRVLLSEELRLGRGIPTVIVEDNGGPAAETLVLSGRSDAVAVPVPVPAAIAAAVSVEASRG
ncbi:FAD-dependent monooxygenase [Arthrobacter sp. VKM Ac-2550]|uniref:FAD-dependent monooxygenase n=1 Tax=Crystallibacter permensis TaxID=1938888 RepID=UPI0022264C06|nr:FAD-dependent monooxygenase [Arthrobacter sp. VKM Ac-2550]MCW2135244.1 anthraniloyl-CoA monooxygenase [Arthrobacter sp. VKM Ac-2550]